VQPAGGGCRLPPSTPSGAAGGLRTFGRAGRDRGSQSHVAVHPQRGTGRCRETSLIFSAEEYRRRIKALQGEMAIVASTRCFWDHALPDVF